MELTSTSLSSTPTARWCLASNSGRRPKPPRRSLRLFSTQELFHAARRLRSGCASSKELPATAPTSATESCRRRPDRPALCTSPRAATSARRSSSAFARAAMCIASSPPSASKAASPIPARCSKPTGKQVGELTSVAAIPLFRRSRCDRAAGPRIYPPRGARTQPSASVPRRNSHPGFPSFYDR